MTAEQKRVHAAIAEKNTAYLVEFASGKIADWFRGVDVLWSQERQCFIGYHCKTGNERTITGPHLACALCRFPEVIQYFKNLRKEAG